MHDKTDTIRVVKKKESQPRQNLFMTQSMFLRHDTVAAQQIGYQGQLPVIKVSLEKLRALDDNEVRRRRENSGGI
jgi:hypothetical protein